MRFAFFVILSWLGCGQSLPYDINTFQELNDPNYITEGLYSNIDEDGTTYYYRGNIKNNNLQFGTYEEDYYIYHGKEIMKVIIKARKVVKRQRITLVLP